MSELLTSHLEALNELYQERKIADWTRHDTDPAKDREGMTAYTVWLKDPS